MTYSYCIASNLLLIMFNLHLKMHDFTLYQDTTKLR